MSRWVLSGLMGMAVLVATTGCNKTKKAELDPQSPDVYGGGYDTSYQNPSSISGTSGPETYASAAPATGGGKTHTVVKGDTLYSLARQYYGDQAKWKEIQRANNIPDPNKIYPGQKLVIP